MAGRRQGVIQNRPLAGRFCDGGAGRLSAKSVHWLRTLFRDLAEDAFKANGSGPDSQNDPSFHRGVSVINFMPPVYSMLTIVLIPFVVV